MSCLVVCLVVKFMYYFTEQVKKAVVVTARVHPGETNGSWMMKGLLDYLLGDTEDAKVCWYKTVRVCLFFWLLVVFY